VLIIDGVSSTAGRRDQPWVIRLTHWINVPALIVMAASGLQIFVAFPYFGPRGATYGWVPLSGHVPPAWMRMGGWLAGARALHFAFAWLLVTNGVGYLIYFAGSGEWRRRLFRPLRDTRGAVQMGLYYLRLRKQPPPAELYNPLQRMAYLVATLAAIVQVLTGLAIYKPTQLSWLVALFGGYDVARLLHFTGLVVLALFTAAHLVLVALHPRSLIQMLTGGARR